jgi:glycosyltransferase involved in cell wall biosynthesis
MNDIPLVSIGLPVFNGERFLASALDSILAQTFEDFELIISDNASTDDTEQICREYAAQDRRIRYFRNEKNLGAAKNFNRVFELSSGEYFRWNSADDSCAPDLVEKCKKILDEHSEAILCHPKTSIIDERGKLIRPYDDSLDLRSPRARDRFRQLNIKLRLCNAHYGLIRSRILRKTSLIGNYPGSDIVLFAELALHGQFFEIPEYLFFRRFHSQASSSLTSSEKAQEFMDPKSVGRFCFTEWRHLLEYARAIQRAPLDLTEKVVLDFEVLRMANWRRRQLLGELANALHPFV